MDCGSCGTVNAPGRRYCRECGGRLGTPCTICHFFNGIEDKHCGGCGRRLRTAPGSFPEEVAPSAYAPALAGDLGFAGEQAPAAAGAVVADESLTGTGVSQSEIDGLFENILDEEPGEGGS